VSAFGGWALFILHSFGVGEDIVMSVFSCGRLVRGMAASERATAVGTSPRMTFRTLGIARRSSRRGPRRSRGRDSERGRIGRRRWFDRSAKRSAVTRLAGGESLECRRVLASAAPADPTSTVLADSYISLAEDNAGFKVTVPLGGSGHGAGDIVSVYVNGGATPGSGFQVAQSAALTGKEASVSLAIPANAMSGAGNEGKINTLYAEIIDLTGNNSTGASFRSPGVPFTLDTTPPTIGAFAQVGGSTINAVGAVISLEATASEPVTGSIAVTLDTGAVVTLKAAPGSNTLTGSYTVATKQNSPDLAVVSYTAGNAKDVAGNPLGSLTSALGSIGGTTPIVVDTTPPTVVTVDLPPAATYFVTATPQTLTLTVNFSESVTLPITAFVRGFIGPNGNSNAFAVPADFLFSQTLNGGRSYEFTYDLVTPTPPTAALPPDIDGITFDTTIWDTNTPGVPAVILDQAANPVAPTTGALGTALTPNPSAINIGPSTTVAKVEFDPITPSPRVEPVQVITLTFKDSTGTGAAVPFGPGLGSLALTEDFQLRRNGRLIDLTTPDSNGKTAEFTYVTNPADPFYASRFQIRNIAHLTSLPGSYRLTFSDLGIGPSTELTWTVTYETPGELTATVTPQPVVPGGSSIRTTPVDSVKVVFTTTDSTGATVPVVVKNVDTAVSGTAIKQFRLYKDEAPVPFPAAARVTGSGSTYYVTGLATVTQDTGSYDLVVVPDSVVNSLGATVQISTLSDTPLIAATGTTWQYANTTITAATVESPAAGVGVVRRGGWIDLKVSFSSTVVVDPALPAPTIDVYLTTYGNGAARATYIAGSGTKDLTFRYMVQTGDESPAGVAFASLIALNGGSLADVTGRQPLLSFKQPSGSDVVVDTVAPRSQAFVLPIDGTYGRARPLSFGVSFNEAMKVTGSPQLSFTYGAGQARKATFERVEGSTVYFRYDVLATDGDGSGVTASAVSLNGGVITDLAGNVAVLTGLAAAAAPGVSIDTAAPYVVSATTASVPNGVAPATLTFTLSKASPDFEAAALVAANGTLGSIIKLTATTYQAAFTPTPGFEGVATVTIPAAAFRDAAGNANVLQQFPLNVDAKSPMVALVAQPASVTSANGSTTITANFTETPAVVPAILVSPAGLGAITTPSGSNPASATFTALPDKEGTVTVWIADKSYADAAGNPGSAAVPLTLAIDTLAPAVTNVTSTKANGSYKAGETITIVVTFREPVTVIGGTPTLRLNAGASAIAFWNGSGSGTTALAFDYVVEAGDSATKLDYADTAALALGGATIRDTAGNDASLTLPAVGALGSISALKNIVVDTLAPTITIAATPTTLTGVQKATVKFTTSSDTAATILNGKSLPAGSVQGGTLTALRVTSAAGGREYTATFTPTLNATETGGITIPAGWFTDRAGNANDVTVMPGTIVHVPTVQSVTTATTSGRYMVGSAPMLFTVVFDEPVTINGSLPRLALNTAANRFATYESGNGTSSLTFKYVVQPGDSVAALDYASAAALVGDLRNASDTAAVTTLPVPGDLGSISQQVTIAVDTVAPLVAAIRPRNTPNAAYAAGTKVRLQVEFSEPVVVTSGIPTLKLNASGSSVAVWNGVGSGTNRLVFVYTVQRGDNVGRLDAAGAGSLVGAIRDLTGNLADLTAPAGSQSGALASTGSISIDTLGPAVAAVFTPDPAGAYRAGTGIWIQVRFTENVVVTGSPQLLLNTAANRVATFHSGSGTDTLLFLYIVQSGDSAAALDYASQSALVTNGGTIRDLAGNAATLLLAQPGGPGSIAAGKAVWVDTSAPQVATVQAISSNGSYGLDQTVRVVVTMSEPVRVSGAGPALLLNTRPGRQAVFEGPFDTLTSTLSFLYTIQPGDNAARLEAVALSAAGGSLLDEAGNAAITTLPAAGSPASLSGSSAIVIDAVVRASAGGLATTPETAPSYNVPLTRLTLTFNTPVSGMTLNAVRLFYEGRSVSLTGATLTGSGASYTLTFPSTSTSLKGLYRLRIGGSQSGVNSRGIAMEPATNLYWRRA